MHPDIHLTLHRLNAAELRPTIAARTTAHAAAAAPATPIRVQLGWRLVEFGLRLALPGPSRPTTRRLSA